MEEVTGTQHRSFQSIFEAAPECIKVMTPQGRVLEINPAGLQIIHGRSIKQLESLTMFDFVHPGDHAAVREALARAAAGETVDVQYRITTFSKEEIYIQSHLLLMKWPKSGEKELLAISVDITKLKQNEAALRESEERFRGLVESIREVFWIKDITTGKLLFISHTFEELWGMKVEELKDDTEKWLEAVHADDRERTREAFRRSSTTPNSSYSYRIVRPDNSIKWIEARTFGIYDGEGKLTRLAGIAKDISHLKEVEEQLVRLNKLYALANRVNGLLVRIHEEAELFQAACNIAVELGGLRMAWVGKSTEGSKIAPVATSGHVVGYFDRVYISSELIPQGAGPAGVAFRTGKTVVSNDIANDPNFYSKEEARVREYRSCASYPLFSGGKVVAVLILYSAQINFFNQEENNLLSQLTENISVALENLSREAQRQQATEALAAGEERYRLIVENSTDLISELDAEGNYIYASPSFTHVLGYDPEELLGRSAFEFLHPDNVEHVKGLFAEAEGAATFRYKNKSGRWHWIEASGRRYPHKQGNLSVVVVGRDITSRIEQEANQERLEAQLRQAQKMEAIGRLAGGIAHDFNNLLAIINGYSGLIQLQGNLPLELNEAVGAILAAGEKAAGLTKQLLGLSRKQVLDVKSIDLSVVVREMSHLLRRTLGEDILLHVEASTPCPVMADRGQMEQIILNLVVNSRDSMPRGGSLHLTCRLVNPGADLYAEELQGISYCLLEVKDSGTGIPTEIMDQIFEPFFSTKGDRGTGLGLATVYSIVKQSAGVIKVRSEIGKGTTFYLFFPLAHYFAGISSAPQKEFATGSGQILVVEDEANLQRLIQLILTKHGYTVIQANSGDEALRLSLNPETRFDLLLTDVVMPGGLSGGELSEKVKEHRPEVAVLYMSGYSDDAIVQRGITYSTACFLAKPFTPAELLNKVSAMLQDKS